MQINNSSLQKKKQKWARHNISRISQNLDLFLPIPCYQVSETRIILKKSRNHLEMENPEWEWLNATKPLRNAIENKNIQIRKWSERWENAGKQVDRVRQLVVPDLVVNPRQIRLQLLKRGQKQRQQKQRQQNQRQQNQRQKRERKDTHPEKGQKEKEKRKKRTDPAGFRLEGERQNNQDSLPWPGCSDLRRYRHRRTISIDRLPLALHLLQCDRHNSCD